METRCGATQASGASGVDRDKAAGWLQPNTDQSGPAPDYPAGSCLRTFLHGLRLAALTQSLIEEQVRPQSFNG